MTTIEHPSDVAQVVDLVRAAAGSGRRIAVRGGDTNASVAPGAENEIILDTSAMTGVVAYDAPELVLTAWAGTPLVELEALLGQSRQMLAFEPSSYAGLCGADPKRTTLGGVLATNASGPRRILAGAARDHFLGVEAVSGRGVAFKAGGRVVKNVTGYDLPKLMAGSWGGLAVMTVVTVKVLPRPPEAQTLLIHGLDDAAAVAAMSQAQQTPTEISGAAHLPDMGVTALRLEGFGPSIAARLTLLQALMKTRGDLEVLTAEASDAFWRARRTLAHAPTGDESLWRLSVPPAAGAVVTAALEVPGATWTYDWGGGLIWLTSPAAPDAHAGVIRAACAIVGGHATLVKPGGSYQGLVQAFPPEPPIALAMARRVKAAFDPQGVLRDRRALRTTTFEAV